MDAAPNEKSSPSQNPHIIEMRSSIVIDCQRYRSFNNSRNIKLDENAFAKFAACIIH